MLFFLTIVLGILDRIRGNGGYKFLNKTIIKLLMAVCVLGILGVELNSNLYYLSAFLISYLIGASFGWGTAIGAGLDDLNSEQFKYAVDVDRKLGRAEFYLRGPFSRSWELALMARGFLWAFLPALVLYFWVGSDQAFSMLMAYMVGMPLAVDASNHLKKHDGIVTKFLEKLDGKPSSDRWGHQELYRGILVGILLIL